MKKECILVILNLGSWKNCQIKEREFFTLPNVVCPSRRQSVRHNSSGLELSTEIKEFYQKVTGHVFLFKEVPPSDKQQVLSMNKNIYGGLDFLPECFDSFMEDPNISCIAIHHQHEMIGCTVARIINDDDSVHFQGIRVADSKQGQGFYRPFALGLRQIVLEAGYKKITTVRTAEGFRSLDYNCKRRNFLSMLHFVTPVLRDTKYEKEERVTGHLIESIKPVTKYEIVQDYFKDKEIREHLFPSGVFMVGMLPLNIESAKPELIVGTNCHFSSVHRSDDGVRGILSSAYILKHPNGLSSYNITITGSETRDLEKHLEFHRSRALEIVEPSFCFQLFAEKSCIEVLPSLLYKCGLISNGYVKHGKMFAYEIPLEK